MRQGYLKSTARQVKLVFLSILLLLLLNMAYIQHQQQYLQHHHQHDCQLYANACHGMSPALPVVIAPANFQRARIATQQVHLRFTSRPAFRARAPPVIHAT